VEEVVYVYQEANARTSIEYGIPFVSLTVVDIPASGGAISSGTVTYSQSQRQYYTSGGYEDLSDITSGGTITYGSAVTAGSLGTTVKGRASVGTLTATVTMNGKSGSDTADVYQEANEATYGDVTVTATTPVSIPASGGLGTISPNASQTVSYTSGSTREGSVSFAYEVKTSKTGFSLSGATVNVAQNMSTSPRNGFVVMVTATGEGSKLATTDVTFNQAGASVVLPSWNAQDNYNFDADPQDSVQISISDPNNKGWEIRGNDNEFIVVDQEPHRLSTPYSGTGSVSFEFYLDPNTESSVILNTVYLYSGSTLCESFSYVQEFGASLDVTPTSLTFNADEIGPERVAIVTVVCPGEFIISKDASLTWLGYAKQQDSTVEVYCNSVNDGTQQRVGEITFSYNGKSIDVTVVQKGSTVTPDPSDTLDVTPTELSFVANGEGKTITITSNGDWTIS
jgi:hypothetical protein